MGAWRTGQQSNRPRRWVQRLKRYPLWLRFLLVMIMGGGIASATYILIMHGNFLGQDQTANNQFILSSALAVLGIVISILLYFIPLSESKKEPPAIKQTITASGGGTVSKSPQSVKEHAGSRDISQNIAATDHGQVTESGQSVQRT